MGKRSGAPRNIRSPSIAETVESSAIVRSDMRSILVTNSGVTRVVLEFVKRDILYEDVLSKMEQRVRHLNVRQMA